MSFDDDDDNGGASPDNSSDNDIDETMDDADDGDGYGDADGDADQDEDGDGDEDGDPEGDNDEEEGENDEDEEGDEQQDGDLAQILTARNTSIHTPRLSNGTLTNGDDTGANPRLLLTSPSPRPRSSNANIVLPFRPSVRPEALTALVYDIVPTIAAPHSTSINAVTATPDMRWVFSGGSDGYIRKFNWIDTANGKLPLTVAQRHPFVDSVTKAGVLLSYWENEDAQDVVTNRRLVLDAPTLSPVYSLATQCQGLWLLSGLESGGINLQSVRHDEGRRITCLRKHTSAVSVLCLAPDERSVLSGSWDKAIHDWDLNTGQVKRSFEGSGSQISAIEPRPFSSVLVPRDTQTVVSTSTTFSSNNVSKPLTNGVLPNGTVPQSETLTGDSGGENSQLPNGINAEYPTGSPDDLGSLFGDDDDNGGGAPAVSFGNEDDEDDEFTRAIASGLQQQEEDPDGDIDMTSTGGPVQPPKTITSEAPETQITSIQDTVTTNSTDTISQDTIADDIPKSEELPDATEDQIDEESPSTPQSSENTFLDASIDGTLRIWDRRQQNPIARIVPGRATPPWCMNACWSPDGNSIFAGRRNGTVDEYSLHKGLREPRRTFKFPAVSGPVSAVRAMPNGKHLVCASYDILRLYDLKEEENTRHSTVPFLIVPGHRTGVISQLYIDSTCTFMISTAGNRGWEGSSTEVLLGYEIGIGR